MYLITKWFGVFLLDKGKIVDKILFKKNEEEISKKLKKIKNKEILFEEKKIIKDNNVIVCEKRLQKIGKYEPNNFFFKKNILKPETFGFSNFLLQKASIIESKTNVNNKLKSKDLQIIQMINTLDDLIQTSNLLSERLECWSDISIYKKNRIKPLENVFSTVKKEINILEEQIDKDMYLIAPNICKVAGSIIGARLISYAGGMKNLSVLPASTVQILGAEKALFRHIKTGAKPPKFGILMQHPLITNAKKENKGRVARALADKISIAVKIDYFKGKFAGDRLRKELEARFK